MLNWQPQTGEMTSCHWRTERRRVWKVPSSFAFHTSYESNSIPLISFRRAAVRLSTHPHQRGQYGLLARPVDAANSGQFHLLQYGWV